MCGDKKGGFSIFWADDGLDTGPILLQREVDVDPNDTVDTLYNRFMYPEGIKAMVCFLYFAFSLFLCHQTIIRNVLIPVVCLCKFTNTAKF